MIDSHCHLADKKFANDLDHVIARAIAAGVDRMICIADSLEEGEKCIAIAGEYENVYATVGVHPHVSEKYEVGSMKYEKKRAMSFGASPFILHISYFILQISRFLPTTTDYSAAGAPAPNVVYKPDYY